MSAGMTDHKFDVEAMVREYFVYQSIWMDGEILNCYGEVGNTYDPSAIALRKDAVRVGHIPHTICDCLSKNQPCLHTN